MRQFLRFAAIGCVGFAIDAGALVALMEVASLNPFAARFVSFPLAVLGTWALNRRFVFASSAASPGDAAREYGRYFGVQTIGAATNMLVYVIAILSLPALSSHPVAALALGALAGLVVNFVGAKSLVFRGQRISTERQDL